jgi:hypothetical protein
MNGEQSEEEAEANTDEEADGNTKEEVPKDLFSLHSGLNRRLKEYEQVLDSFPVEVLNEYRYAARSSLQMIEILLRHVDLEAFQSSGDYESYRDFYEQVEHAFRCGYHDLVDGLLYEIARYLDEVTKNLSSEAISAMGSLRDEILNDIEVCNKLVAESREKLPQREDLYDSIYRDWYPKLLAHKKVLTQSVIPKVLEVQRSVEKDRDALLQMRVEEERLSLRRHSISTRMALAGIGATLVLSIIQIILALRSTN